MSLDSLLLVVERSCENLLIPQSSAAEEQNVGMAKPVDQEYHWHGRT